MNHKNSLIAALFRPFVNKLSIEIEENNKKVSQRII